VSLRLGLLDFCPVEDNGTPEDALWTSIELAKRADTLGFSRYWFTEHHSRDVAHSSPELMMMAALGTTSTIRVGSAGVLLNYRSPYAVASSFRCLHSLFLDRVDLGLARGTLRPLLASLLRGAAASEDAYEDKVTELTGFLRGLGDVPALPASTPVPEIWCHGSRSTTARIAAKLGVRLCMARFFSVDPSETKAAIQYYRDNFVPSPELGQPRWAIAVAGACGRTESEARDDVASWGDRVSAGMVGTSDVCRRYLEDVAVAFETDDVVVLEMSRTHERRTDALDRLAESCQLSREQ
jgi:luciferase family oxidoreductase group 1